RGHQPRPLDARKKCGGGGGGRSTPTVWTYFTSKRAVSKPTEELGGGRGYQGSCGIVAQGGHRRRVRDGGGSGGQTQLIPETRSLSRSTRQKVDRARRDIPTKDTPSSR
ncbi:unnamed protein product, partial [Ectocarpus sp. 12 AP-2014]